MHSAEMKIVRQLARENLEETFFLLFLRLGSALTFSFRNDFPFSIFRLIIDGIICGRHDVSVLLTRCNSEQRRAWSFSGSGMYE